MDMEENVTAELTRTWADGKTRTMLSYKCPVKSDSGEVIALATILTDITDSKKAEETAKSPDARMTDILQIAPEAVITISSDMNIQLFNTSAERIFGYRAEEVLGQPMEILMPEPFRDAHGKHIEGLDNSGDSHRLMDQRQEIFGLRKDGTEFPASASVSKLDIGGERIFTVMLRDITERKQAEEALRMAQDELETQVEERTRQLTDEPTERKRAEEQIKASLGEKDVLLQEIHHRVKNNLQRVSSFLSLQADVETDIKIGADPDNSILGLSWDLCARADLATTNKIA